MFVGLFACGIDSSQYPEQLFVFEKERNNGWYHTLPYMLAHSITSLPMLFSNVFIWSVITKYMVGLETSLWMMYLILFLNSVAADTLGFCIAVYSNGLETSIIVCFLFFTHGDVDLIFADQMLFFSSKETFYFV